MGRRDDLEMGEARTWKLGTSISDVATRLRTGQTTSVELVERCLGAIVRQDGELNAFITVLDDDARDTARLADIDIAAGRYRGPLHGVPISVKDVFDLRGLPTTAASRVRAGHRATVDAPVLASLRAAGAIFIGKCNLHEFAFGTTGEASAFGPTRNPRALGHIPGGSSSGSAVSVAAGMALASIGTDTGGSIRIPAAACGVVGLKPTYGELSCANVVPLATSLDHVGPIGLTVADCGLIYSTMRRGGHPREPDTRTSTPSTRVRLGLPRRYFLDLVDPEVKAAFDQTVERLQGAGCLIDDVDIPHAPEIASAYLHTVLSEAAACHAHTLATRPTDYTPSVRERLDMGRSVPPEDYRRAQQTRDILRREVDAALNGRQALLLPTLPIPAPPLGVTTVTIGAVTEDVRALTLRLTQLFDLTGHPAVSVPCGTTSSGLPCGAQLVGERDRTLELVHVASTLESAVRGDAVTSMSKVVSRAACHSSVPGWHRCYGCRR